MSFFYDRDYNVTGTVQTTFDFKPSYGTTVSFSSELATYGTVDNYLYTMPKALNHLQMTVQMPFENRKEEEARKISSFFENLKGTGYFTFTDPAQIYKPINLFCQNIQTDFVVNDIYNIQVSLSSDQASSLLNWNGLFITGSSIKGNWATSTVYAKYDVVRYTGNSTFPSNTGNLYDSYYYCKEAHTSQPSVTPASVDTPKWTKDFFFQPTYQTQVGKETSVLKTELPYSFTKRTDFGLHGNTLKSFKLDFKGVSDTEARCILHFLINKQGYRKFQYKIPKIYNQYKIFFAPEWSHTFVYKNVNDISVTLVEDPLGRDVNETQNIITNGLVFYIDSGNTASYRSPSATIYDISSNAYTGTVNGSPAFSSQNGGSILLDAVDDYILVNNNNFGVGGKAPNCTLSIWAKLIRINSYVQVAGFRNDSDFGFFFLLLDSGGATVNTEARINTTAGIFDISYNYASFFDKWTNIAFAAYGNIIKLYLNANLVGSTSISGNFGATSSNFLIGVNPNLSAYKTKGNIASVLFYNRGLSEQEINQNFNAAKDRFKL